MVPPHSPEAQNSKKCSKSSGLVRSAVISIKLHFSSHPRFWIFISFLWVQALIISFSRSPLACFPDRSATIAVRYPEIHNAVEGNVTENEAPVAAMINYSEECPSGRIFVYELPPSLNRDLVKSDCTDLDQWRWDCGIIPNHGYGRAAAELRRFLPGDLYKSWYHTNQYTLEVIFHHRVLRHKCRTSDPESATGFYIPFYAGLAVGKHLWVNDTDIRDSDCYTMLDWVQNQKHWKKTNGSDHFMSIGRVTWDFRRLTDPGKAWGSTFLNMPLMNKITRFIVEKYPGDEMDISVPYPTGFHPKTIEDLSRWQSFIRSYNRSSLFAFIEENPSWAITEFRQFVMNQCSKESAGSCRAVDCSITDCWTNSSTILLTLLDSEFCLQPIGNTFTSKSAFECVIAGSIPVFFTKTAYEQYDWFFPGEPESYSVFIDPEEARNGNAPIKSILSGYSRDEIRRKREKLIETIPTIIYAKPSGRVKKFKDAFDVALDGVLERIREEKEWVDFLRRKL